MTEPAQGQTAGRCPHAHRIAEDKPLAPIVCTDCGAEVGKRTFLDSIPTPPAHLEPTDFVAKPPGCGCPCHTTPGVKHFVACCDAPPALDIDLQDIIDRAMPKGPIPGGVITVPVPHHTHPPADGPGEVTPRIERSERETVRDIIADTLLEHGYCLGVPDFTMGPAGQTKGNLELADLLASALVPYETADDAGADDMTDLSGLLPAGDNLGILRQTADESPGGGS